MTDIEPTRPHPPASDQSPKGLLDLVEWVGNKLPDPVMLFFGGAILVMVLSGIGKWAGWSVEKPVVMPVTQAVLDETGVPVQVYSFSNVGRVNKLDLVEVDEDGDGVAEAFEAKRAVVRTPLVERFTDGEGRESYKLKTEAGTEPVRVNSLFSREGARWAIDSMVTNFTSFHPLGVVLVAMLGIGVAEKTGCIAALLKALMLFTPMRLLTPATVFVGVMSSMAADAGYVVLPPLAAALYKSVGRSPLVGLAAVFCGVGGGFSANLLPTSIDPLLAGLTQEGAQILNPAYTVNPLCNYFFMIASTVMLTLVGWAVTSLVVERRYEKKRAEEGGPAPLTAEDEAARHISPGEVRGLVWAGIWLAIGTALSAALILVPGAPLYADPGEGARWPNAIVPLLFVLFLIPGVVYGIVTGAIKGETGAERLDVGIARMMGHSMADMGPYIVLAFFAAQFIAYFNYTNLGVMLAIKGGEALSAAALPPALLLPVFVIVVMFGNLFIGSASAKYAFFAPVFVPMFMQAGISPELTQGAYRVGDSISNTITPLNPYFIIILVFAQKYMPKAGIGTLVSLMLPYALAMWVAWTVMLVVWILIGAPLGFDGGLEYVAGGG